MRRVDFEHLDGLIRFTTRQGEFAYRIEWER